MFGSPAVHGYHPQLLTVAEVAAMLRISRSKLYALLRSGGLSYRRIGGSIRFTDDDVLAYLDASRVVGEKARPSRRIKSRHFA